VKQSTVNRTNLKTERALVALVEGGMSAFRAAERVGVHFNTAVRILRRLGREDLIRSNAQHRAVRDRLIESLADGKTLQQAADAVGLTLKQAKNRLRDI